MFWVHHLVKELIHNHHRATVLPQPAITDNAKLTKALLLHLYGSAYRSHDICCNFLCILMTNINYYIRGIFLFYVQNRTNKKLYDDIN